MPPKQPAEAAKAPKVKGGINKAEQAAAIKEHKSLFNSTPKSFAIGNSVQPVRNLSRYVKWPKCASPSLHRHLPLPPNSDSRPDTSACSASAQSCTTA